MCRPKSLAKEAVNVALGFHSSLAKSATRPGKEAGATSKLIVRNIACVPNISTLDIIMWVGPMIAGGTVRFGARIWICPLTPVTTAP